jgi:tetratricopeptide (TPR) repeat protein
MKKSLLLSAALAAVILPMPTTNVFAQSMSSSTPNTRAGRRAAEEAKSKTNTTKVAPTWPNATREAPKQAGSPAVKKQLDALLALQQKNDVEDESIKLADAIIADSRANAFDKSSAAYIAGAAWQSKGTDDYTNAVKYYQQAIDFNGLHNNMHYQAMFQVAQLQDADGHHEEALKSIDRFLAETKSDDPKALVVKNQILMGMDKPELAIGFLEQQTAAHPTDKKLAMGLARAYQDAGQDEKALAQLEKMHKAGLFTESSDYDVAWRLLANSTDGQNKALAMIDEGVAKGILQPSHDIYVYQAQAWYAAGDTDKAIAAWAKGAPMGKDGTSFLNLAKALLDKQRYADATTAAKSALDKGVKKPGDAWQVIGQAEAGLGNKAAAIAAYHEAAKYPETQKWAESALRRASGK